MRLSSREPLTCGLNPSRPMAMSEPMNSDDKNAKIPLRTGCGELGEEGGRAGSAI